MSKTQIHRVRVNLLKFSGPFLEQKSSYSNGSHSKYSFSHNFELHHHLELVSNRILMPCQPHRVNSGQTQTISKPSSRKRARGTQTDVNTPSKLRLSLWKVYKVSLTSSLIISLKQGVYFLFLLRKCVYVP